MKINYKDIIQIITISILLSSLRYFFLEDYPILKKSKLQEVNLNVSELDSLYSFLDNLESPTVLNLELSKMLYDNNLVTFIDSRDIESYNSSHILSSINIPYELVDQIATDYDLKYLNELKEDFTIEIDIDSSSFYISLIDGQFYISNNIDKIKNKSFSSKNFLIYCDGHGCSLSEDLGFYLYNEFGIKGILIYEGGIPEWLESGYPIKND